MFVVATSSHTAQVHEPGMSDTAAHSVVSINKLLLPGQAVATVQGKCCLDKQSAKNRGLPGMQIWLYTKVVHMTDDGDDSCLHYKQLRWNGCLDRQTNRSACS